MSSQPRLDMRQNLQIWLEHFEHHARWPIQVPVGLPDTIDAAEHAAIAPSISTFQCGERSDGLHLRRCAARFARARGLPELERITELFVAEERRHAALLAAWMADHGIAERRAEWTDRVFRALRRIGGFELALSVLLCAELIGHVYYRALEAATSSRRLQALCRVMVADELAHVGYESELLLALRRERGLPTRAVLRIAELVLLSGAALVVWLTHRPVLRRAGHDAGSFLRACHAQHAFYLGTPALRVGDPQSGALAGDCMCTTATTSIGSRPWAKQS